MMMVVMDTFMSAATRGGLGGRTAGAAAPRSGGLYGCLAGLEGRYMASLLIVTAWGTPANPCRNAAPVDPLEHKVSVNNGCTEV